MRAISLDLRERIMKACDSGRPTADVAETFSVSLGFVKKLKHQRTLTGSIAPKPHGGGQPRKLAGREVEIRQLLDGPETLTLAELREKLGVDCSLTTIWQELRRLGYR